jgi:hypothetical protein
MSREAARDVPIGATLGLTIASAIEARIGSQTRFRAKMRPRVRALDGVRLSVLFTLLACSSAGEEPNSCSADGEGPVEVRRDAIIGGELHADYLALSDDERRAIVAIVADDEGPHCSGAQISPTVVLTAQHCIRGAPLASILVGSPELGYWPVLETAADEAADIALLFLEDPLPGAPLGVADAPAEPWLGRRATLAGYGLNDSSASRQLLFATEEVTAVSDTHLTTSGFGRSGACLGDSGGPLLGRAELGRVVVLGILTSGSASCEQEDRFRRADSFTAFIRDHVGALPDDDGCGALTFEGRCFDEQAVWCEDGVRRAELCAGARACGWDAAAEGYRCVDPKLGCTGADAFGACVDAGARRCAPDAHEYSKCTPCQRCGFDPRTGRAACYPG